MFNTVKRSLKRAGIAIMRSRQERAAREMAQFLIRDNQDFRTVNEDALTRAILSKKEIKLDQVSGL